jgi:hypothetical protein
MKVEAQDRCVDVPIISIQSDESDDEQIAQCSVTIRNGKVRTVCVGVDSVPDVVWKRSGVLSDL